MENNFTSESLNHNCKQGGEGHIMLSGSEQPVWA